MDNLDQVLIRNIFGAGNDWLGIPAEWPYEKFQEAKDEILPHENSVGKKYKEFIQLSRHLLKV